MSIGLYVKIVLTAGIWDNFYFCKKNSKKRKKIFKYEKPFIKYAKLIFKNAKRFSNMRNSISKTRNLYSFLLNLCKLRRTYSVCAFAIMGYFQICKTFHQKREIDFQIRDILFQKCNSFCVLCEKWNYNKQHNRRRNELCYSRVNLGILIFGTTLFGFRSILFHHGTLI